MTSLAFYPDEKHLRQSKGFLEKETRLDIAGWQCRKWAERTSRPKPHTFVETDRLPLVGTRFEAQDQFVYPAGLVLDFVQKSLRNPPTACRRPGMHALDLGVIVDYRDAATADCDAVQPRQEEAHMWFEQWTIERA